MKTDLYTSNRKFNVFDSLASHGQLLMRSQKTDFCPYNIDIIFYGVFYMQINAMMDGIAIQRSDRNIINKYEPLNKYLSFSENNLFEIKCNGESYYIACSFFRVFENELSFKETSLGVLEYKGREKEIARSF